MSVFAGVVSCGFGISSSARCCPTNNYTYGVHDEETGVSRGPSKVHVTAVADVSRARLDWREAKGHRGAQNGCA
jgi:hypothetical protein